MSNSIEKIYILTVLATIRIIPADLTNVPLLESPTHKKIRTAEERLLKDRIVQQKILVRKLISSEKEDNKK